MAQNDLTTPDSSSSEPDDDSVSNSRPGCSRSRSPIESSEGDKCRICMLSSCIFCQGATCELVNVCNCSGTIRCVHEHCLVTWLTRSQRTSCELCGSAFPLWLVPMAAMRQQHIKQVGEQRHRIEQEETRMLELLHRNGAEMKQWDAQQLQHGNRLLLLQRSQLNLQRHQHNSAQLEATQQQREPQQQQPEYDNDDFQ